MSVEVSGAASVDLVADLDQQVRSVVRREGVDPQLDVPRVRRIAEERRARPRRPQPDRCRRPGARPGRRDRRAGRAGLRLRSAAACSSTTPRSRRSGSTSPSRVFVARNGRHELTNVILTKAEVRGARRADAQVQRSSDRPVPAVRRRDAAGRAIGCTSCSRESAATSRRSTSASSSSRPRGSSDLVRLGSLPTGRGAFPRGGGARRAEHRGRRRRRRLARPRC